MENNTVQETKEETPQEDKNVVKKILDYVTNNGNKPFSAEMAWIETTYGKGSFRPIDKRITDKQRYIRQSIESKFGNDNQGNGVRFSSYHCVIDIEDDLADHIAEIFSPFSNAGFKIISLSECIDEINDENVFLVSWKNAFLKKNKSK